MKKIINLMLITSFILIMGCKRQNNTEQKTIKVDGQTFVDLNKDGILQPYEDTRLATKERVDDLMSQLSNEEKISLLIGTGMEGIGNNDLEDIRPVVGESNYSIPGAAGTTTPLSKFGIPAIVMTDGPAGVRIKPIRENDENTYYATGFPVGIALASTWNTELVEKVGEAIGNEALEYGSDIQLAPAMNIMRNPLCGRNYEYYSEDPLISGKIASAMTKGIQSQNVGASLKHYVANNNETNRMLIDVKASPRTMREIYLRGFEIAVKESKPKTVMSSYNKFNGTYVSASKELLTTILRDEWGFKGVVMTDWFGGYSGLPSSSTLENNVTINQVLAGNDLLMPGLETQKKDISEGLKNGALTMEDIDLCVRRIVTLIFETPKMSNYAYSSKPNLPAHAEIARDAAAESIILLENKNETLPFSPEIKAVSTFGISSFNHIAGGTGSGNVNKAYTISLNEHL